MSNPGDSDETPLTSVRQMAEYLAVGCKPPEAFRIGTEHEKFGVQAGRPLPAALRAGGRSTGQHPRHAARRWRNAGGEPDPRRRQHHRAEAGRRRRSRWNRRASWSCPARRLPTCTRRSGNWHAHFDDVRVASEPLGHGFRAAWLSSDRPPATRCRGCPRAATRSCGAICRRSGQMGLDMMTRTCTVQVNLDYASEADMRRKLRISLLLQPLATALFANSPVHRGQAERLSVLSGACLDRYRQPALRHPQGDVRGRLRLRALCRLADRTGADVFRLS